MGSTAKRTAIVTLVAGSIVVLALALWKIRIVIALVFLGVIIAAAMRPGIDWLQRARACRDPWACCSTTSCWPASSRSSSGSPCRARSIRCSRHVSGSGLHQQATQSTGIKHDILTGLDKRLGRLPSGEKILHPAVEVTKTAFEVLVGIFFLFAVAAYWIFERDRTIALVQSMVPPKHRRVTRDTWVLIDQKLGAFVRGQLILIVFVAVVLSAGFFAIGLPYWLLIGAFAGVVEIVPVIGPLAAGALAVGVGLTQSWHMALFAGLVVLVVRQFEDYIVMPRVLGHAVGLSPLLVLVSVTSIGILLGALLRPARDPDHGRARDARRRRRARRRPGRAGGAGRALRRREEEDEL